MPAGTSLFIKEESIAQFRQKFSVKLNSMEAEANLASNIHRDRKAYGKMEEGEETITRKFKLE